MILSEHEVPIEYLVASSEVRLVGLEAAIAPADLLRRDLTDRNQAFFVEQDGVVADPLMAWPKWSASGESAVDHDVVTGRFQGSPRSRPIVALPCPELLDLQQRVGFDVAAILQLGGLQWGLTPWS